MHNYSIQIWFDQNSTFIGIRLAQIIVLSSQTTFLVLATSFSHSLGLKYYRKIKIENFQAFFNPAQAFQSFRLYHLFYVLSMYDSCLNAL